MWSEIYQLYQRDFFRISESKGPSNILFPLQIIYFQLLKDMLNGFLFRAISGHSKHCGDTSMLLGSITPISGRRLKTWWSRLSWVQSPAWPVFITTMLPVDIPVLSSLASTSCWTPSWSPGCWRWTSLPACTAPAHWTWMWKVPWLLSSSTWPGL